MLRGPRGAMHRYGGQYIQYGVHGLKVCLKPANSLLSPSLKKKLREDQRIPNIYLWVCFVTWSLPLHPTQGVVFRLVSACRASQKCNHSAAFPAGVHWQVRQKGYALGAELQAEYLYANFRFGNNQNGVKPSGSLNLSLRQCIMYIPSQHYFFVLSHIFSASCLDWTLTTGIKFWQY